MTNREYTKIKKQLADMNNKLNDIMEALEIPLSTEHEEDKKWFVEQALNEEDKDWLELDINEDDEEEDLRSIYPANIEGSEEFNEANSDSRYGIYNGKLTYNPQSNKWFIMDNDHGHLYKVNGDHVYERGYSAGDDVQYIFKEGNTVHMLV